MDRELFWIYGKNAEELGDIGFAWYSVPHLIYLALLLLFILLFTAGYRRGGEKRRDDMRKLLALFLLFFEIFKQCIDSLHGLPPGVYLPFELCSLAEYVILFDAVWPENRITKQLIALAFLPSAFMALLMPSANIYPPFSFFAIHQFVMHGGIVAYIIARYAAGEIFPRYYGIWLSLFFVDLAVIPVYCVNIHYAKNYMFLAHHENNIVFQTIWDLTGGQGGLAYVLGLEIFVTLVMHIVFAIFVLLRRLRGGAHAASGGDAPWAR